MSMPPIPVNPVHVVDCHMGVRVEGRPDNPIVCYKTQEGRHAQGLPWGSRLREAMAWHQTAEAVARRTELPQDLCQWLENAATMQLDQQKDQKGGCGSVIRYGSARRTDKTNGRLEEYRD